MLIPIGHENMSARRWPVVTIGLILINILAFMATYGTLQKEAPELERIKIHILLLAAMHPELEVPQEVQPLVTSFREKYPAEWDQIRNQKHALIDEFDARMRLTDEGSELQEQMNSLAEEYTRVSSSFIANRYAFVPAHPAPISYLTANFLHGGWLHLIGNMWFLWIAGFVLEDVWGRALYLGVYLAGGVVALIVHAGTNPGSMVPTLGASGAVAALMGAFMIRFPKMKIEMLWVFMILRTYRFKASAYWLLGLWLLTEVFYGTLFGAGSGVAHWAHVGGFIFGALVALALRYTGIERTVNAAIEQQIRGTGAPEISRAQEFIDRKKYDDAVTVLQNYTSAHPSSIEAWDLLRDVCWQKQDMPTCRQAALRCCELHLKAHAADAAWRDYEDFLDSGGRDLPLPIHFELCRLMENQGSFEAAVSEYEKLTAEHPSERQALMAQLAAAKLCLKKLNRIQDALKFYEAAEASPVPHLDLEETIQAGIREARATLMATVPAVNNSGIAVRTP